MRSTDNSDIKLSSGFTLLELLISIGILGILLVGLTDAVRLGLSGWNAQSREAAASQELDSVDRLFRSLLSRLSVDVPTPLRGAPTIISMTALLPDAAAPQLRRADLSLLVTPDHRLVVRWLPRIDRKPATGGDAPTAATPNEIEILRNVESADFSYRYDGPADKNIQPGWKPSWTAPILPSLIRVRLLFLPNDPRHWPDIVAATIIQRP